MRYLAIIILAISATAFAQNIEKLPRQLPQKSPPVKKAAAPISMGEASGDFGSNNDSQDSGQRVKIDSTKILQVIIANSAWNKDSAAADTGSIILRESKTGKLVQLQLEETQANSGVFSGIFSLNWEAIESLAPEFYVPPQNLLESAEGIHKISAMIASGELRRRPVILKKPHKGRQTVELFESREQALSALKSIQEEFAQMQVSGKPAISNAAADAAALARMNAARLAALKAEEERIRQSELEKQRFEEKIRQQKALDEAERARRKAEAARIAQEAMALYQKGNFKESLSRFEQASDLDPENKAYYFQFGVALNKVEQFNKSLVVLAHASGPSVNPLEVSFFMGIDYFRLKDWPNALEQFGKVRAGKDKNMAPSASFYLGLVYFEIQKYKEAQVAFQQVLDESSDPQLDARADQYLEQILRILQFEAERAKRWILTGTGGLMYDSNILNSSNSALDQGTATNSAGLRMLTLGGAKYRPLYSEHREFAMAFDFLNMYSVDTSLNFKQSLRNSDPMVLDLTAPYTFKGVFLKKGFKMDLVPGYETILMSADSNVAGSSDNSFKAIGTSYIGKVLTTLVMSEHWFSNFNLEFRQDTSLLQSSSGDNNQNDTQFKLAWSNLIFRNKEKNKILLLDAAYTLNNAGGINWTYNRIDMGAGYVGNISKTLTYNAKLALYSLTYSTNPNNRVDTNYTGTLGLAKKISDNWSSGLTGSYVSNGSTVDAYSYKKYTLMATLSGNFSL